jgi:hypothetical protein
LHNRVIVFESSTRYMYWSNKSHLLYRPIKYSTRKFEVQYNNNGTSTIVELYFNGIHCAIVPIVTLVPSSNITPAFATLTKIAHTHCHDIENVDALTSDTFLMVTFVTALLALTATSHDECM